MKESQCVKIASYVIICRNCRVAECGKVYFLDTPKPGFEDWHIKEILAYMARKKYSESEKRLVAKTIMRLNVLNHPRHFV